MIDLNEVRKRARRLPAMVQIGKRGLTEGLIREITRQLKRNKVIKIRILKSAKDRSAKSHIIKETVEKTNAVLVDQTGSTLILLKKE